MGEDEEEEDFLKRLADVKRTLRRAKKREALKEVLASKKKEPQTDALGFSLEPEDRTALEKRLTRCEALAVEVFGQGAAVSLDRVRVKGVWSCVATVWDAKGEEKLKANCEGKMQALGALTLMLGIAKMNPPDLSPCPEIPEVTGMER